jgi:hypothetical protein
VRVAEDGRIIDRIQLDRSCFATMLGGADGRTSFMMANEFLGPDRFDEMLAKRTGQVLVADAPAPGAGCDIRVCRGCVYGAFLTRGRLGDRPARGTRLAEAARFERARGGLDP